MTSVITGDIIKSGTFKNPEVWLLPLKEALSKSGIEDHYWEIFRGDSFQIEVKTISESFATALYIKATIKTVKGLDVRMAIGIGSKGFEGKKVSESNGKAFEYSGITLEDLKQEKTNLKIKTANNQLDKELNLYLKLALIAMDNWTVNTAEIVKLSLENKGKLQKDLAQILGINQEAVSKRLKRSYFDEIQELNQIYKEKIDTLLK